MRSCRANRRRDRDSIHRLHRLLFACAAREDVILHVAAQFFKIGSSIVRKVLRNTRIRKREKNERTITSIRELSPAERVEELARMIGGSEITSVARKHARELLKGSGT